MAADTRRRLLALARELEPGFARAFVAAVRAIKSEAQLTLLIEAIERGNVDDAIRILQIRSETFQALDDEMRATFLRGAAYQIESLPKKLTDPSTGAKFVTRFGGSQPRAQEIIRRLGAELVTGLIDGQRAMIADVIEDGLSEGKGAKAIGLDLVGRMDGMGKRRGGVVGLTQRDAERVREFRNSLSVENGGIGVVGFTDDGKPIKKFWIGRDGKIKSKYKSRNKLYDPAIKRAIISGNPVRKDIYEKMENALIGKYLKDRGLSIATTEATAALNQGRREAVQQMIDRGAVQAQHINRTWDATGDLRTRVDHMAMEGQKVAWGQPFVAPDGSLLMGPADSSLGAAADQVIGCRCYEKIVIDFLAMAV